MSQRIIIDTDPGVDDAIAIWLALASPELNVLGVTVVAGNVALKNSVRNWACSAICARRSCIRNWPMHRASSRKSFPGWIS